MELERVWGGGGVGSADEESLGELPDDDAGGGADVEGVLGAELGDFDAAVGGVDNFLVDAFDFVAEDEGVLS